MNDDKIKLIISGGGTGGHIFPALSIAQEFKALNPESEILFVGAKRGAEMNIIPKYGFNIKGLPVRGFSRKNLFKFFYSLLGLFYSLLLAIKIVIDFKPNIVVGFGGYASGPMVKIAQFFSLPTVIQEQNSYPGITNKILAKKAKIICVAYSEVFNFFNISKISLTGNPIRKSFFEKKDKSSSLKSFGLLLDKKTVLVVGGSLGALTLSKSVEKLIQIPDFKNFQILWQVGKNYALKPDYPSNVVPLKFIEDMPAAYTLADVVVSRAGALSISELSLMAKPVIFIPSPNVAEDHQTKNADALVKKGAALMLSDDEAVEKLPIMILELLIDEKKQKELIENIRKTAKPNATKEIVEIIKNVARKSL